MQPAIRLARHGFNVTEDQVTLMDRAVWELGRPNFFVEDPAWAIDFAPNGRRVKVNETMTRKRYADTLDKIAEEGADAFYRGEIAESIIAALQKDNGIMTLRDLEDYAVELRKPVETSYRDFRLVSCSAPSSGVVVLAAMKTAEGYSDFGHPNAVNISTHRLSEAMRFGYAKVSNSESSLEEQWTDRQHSSEQALAIPIIQKIWTLTKAPC